MTHAQAKNELADALAVLAASVHQPYADIYAEAVAAVKAARAKVAQAKRENVQ